MEHTDLELYIQIRDGQPYEHPIFADNFRMAFPDIDTENLPDTFAKFIRVEKPEIDTYEVYEGVEYQWVDGVVKDVHMIRPMTDEERAIKDAELAELAIESAKWQAQGLRDAKILRCNDILAELTDPDQRKLWEDCLAALEAWTLESVDPITPPIPVFPKQDESGNWVAP